MNIRSAAFLAYIGITALHAQASAFTDKQTGIRGARPESITCHVMAIDVMESVNIQQDESDQDPEFKCKLLDDQGRTDSTKYALDLPPVFVQKHPHLGNGRSFVSIVGGRPVWEHDSMEPPAIIYPQNATIQMVDLPAHGRHLQSRESRTHGNKTVLVLRITSPDGTVQLSKEQLSERIFGIGERVPRITVSSQYSACSFDKLNLIPAQGQAIVNGVAEISITDNIVNANPDFLEPIVTSTAESMLGTNLDDTYAHIIFVFPPGTSRRGSGSGWIAFADIGGQRTFYNNKNAGYLSIVMHEIGHNFGLSHSSEHGLHYGDTSGVMGSSYKIVGIPNKCFNGYKNWLLGWFNDYTTTVDITAGAWGGNITSFVSYDVVRPDEFIIVNVGDLYLQYNRAAKFNVFTGDEPNQVTIVKGTSPDERSELLGAVSLVSARPQIQRFQNFQGTGFELVIEACDQVYLSRVSPDLPDYVRVSIHLEDGKQSSACHQAVTAPPSTPPTAPPTAFPTTPPTANPTTQSMTLPTASPTTPPTAARTAAPTAPPTTTTTAPQSSSPSLEPTIEFDSCEDSAPTVTFYINKRHGLKNCIWLMKHPAWRKRACVPEHEAYSICEETCGKCTDNCEDEPGTFYVNKKQPYRDCEWLSTRPFWQRWICREGKAGNDMCKETCNRC